MSLERHALVTLLFATAALSRPEQGPPPVAEIPETKEDESPDTRAARRAFDLSAKRFEGAVELHAGYRQAQESLLLASPIVSTGQFYLRLDPACFVLVADGEDSTIVRSDEREHLVWSRSSKRVEIYEFEANHIATSLIACCRADFERIRKVLKVSRYREYVRAPEGDDPRPDRERRAAEVRLSPELEALRGHISQIWVRFDLAAALPYEVEYENTEGERVRFTLLDPTPVTEVDPTAPSRFDLRIPEGTPVHRRQVRPSSTGSGS